MHEPAVRSHASPTGRAYATGPRRVATVQPGRLPYEAHAHDWFDPAQRRAAGVIVSSASRR
ncbi:hypothetical protein JM78_17440 [Burkholderia pyrrocinia]|nr:hypothetical protein JM78_17440 [Burkholderia pyrrocinia]